MNILCLPMQVKMEAEPEETLLQVASRGGVLIDGNCAGNGKCGKCKVQIISGTGSSLEPEEMKHLTLSEINTGYRLACRLKVLTDLTVRIPQEKGAEGRKTQLTFMPSEVKFTEHIQKYRVKVGIATLEEATDDVSRILKVLEGKATQVSAEVVSLIPEVLLDNEDLEITVAVRDEKIIGLEKGKKENEIYGVAFDIGTTTVVGMLWNLKKRELVEIRAKTNPQSVFGADVISRIQYSSQSNEHLIMCKEKITTCFNEIIQEMTAKTSITANHIYDMVVVGNTTMSHLFLGINPKQLARAPFAPVFCSSLDRDAKDLGIHINPLAQVHLMSNIAGHVGSDITAGILTTRLMEKKGLYLLIDVGTNGEIVLCKDGKALTCSTAAGPAFEGTSIYQGMRASSGAIERVTIKDGQVLITVIEGVTPLGICGSGLIDAVAQMLKAGVVDFNGRLLDQSRAIEKGIHPSLASRLRKGKDGNEFVLSYGDEENDRAEDMVITQKDIREVQLAKGAIYSGIKMLFAEMKLDLEDLDQLIVAGAFGSYIDKESALEIGLFPQLVLEKIISVGNAAGIGAGLALLSRIERDKANEDACHIKHIELAHCKNFQEEYLNAMSFPRSDQK